MSNKKSCNYISYDYMSMEHDYAPTDIEQDLYVSSDNRVWKSNVKDIRGGDNFADYCTYIFRLLNDEGYYDN